MTNAIKISDKLEFLTGEGLEYLVVGDVVIAKFLDGNLHFIAQKVSIQEKTLVPND